MSVMLIEIINWKVCNHNTDVNDCDFTLFIETLNAINNNFAKNSLTYDIFIDKKRTYLTLSTKHNNCKYYIKLVIYDVINNVVNNKNGIFDLFVQYMKNIIALKLIEFKLKQLQTMLKNLNFE